MLCRRGHNHATIAEVAACMTSEEGPGNRTPKITNVKYCQHCGEADAHSTKEEALDCARAHDFRYITQRRN